MNIKPFAVEEWMNEYEVGALYNIAETCVDSVSLDELFELTGENKEDFLKDFCAQRLTYGNIWGSEALRGGISKLYHTIKADEVVLTHGAAGANHHVFCSLISAGDRVVSIMPTYQQLYSIPEAIGADVAIMHLKQENDYLPDLNELKSLVTPETKMICFNNPNNPSGAVYSEDEVKAIAAVIENTSVTVISDEIYEMLDYTGIPTYSIAKYSEALKAQTVVVNGVSKTYSMTGWRIGFIACEAKLAAAISGMQSHMTSNPNTIAQYAAEAAYSHEGGKAFLEEMKKSFDYRRKLIMEKLDAIPELSYVTPQGAFYIMVNVSKLFGRSVGGTIIGSAIGFAHALLDEADVAVIPCEPFGAPDYVRLSYAVSDEDVRKGVDRIADFVAKFEP